MAQRNRSRDARTGRRRLVKLLATTGTLAGGLWFTSQVQAADPPRAASSPTESSHELHGVTLARVGSVCRVLGLQHRAFGEPRALEVQPCQALAPIVPASAEAAGMPDSFASPDVAAPTDRSEPVTEPTTESATEPTTDSAHRAARNDAVRLFRPIPGTDREPDDSARGREFSPFRSTEPTDTVTRAADASTSADASTPTEAVERTSPTTAPSPTAPQGGAATDLAPVVGRRTARATNTSQSPRVDPSRQTIETMQDLQAAQTKLAPRRTDTAGTTALVSGEPLFEVVPETGEMSVAFQESKMLRLREPIGKVAVVDPTVCEVVQFSPREICLLGKSPGTTNITFWVGHSGGQPATYRVTVEADQRAREVLAAEYRQFEQLIGELFPQSNVRLLLIADKVIVKGEARDETEAMRILSVLREANAENPASFVAANGLTADFGPAARLSSAGGQHSRPFGRLQLINMLHIASHPNDLVNSPPTTPADSLRSARKQ